MGPLTPILGHQPIHGEARWGGSHGEWDGRVSGSWGANGELEGVGCDVNGELRVKGGEGVRVWG